MDISGGDRCLLSGGRTGEVVMSRFRTPPKREIFCKGARKGEGSAEPIVVATVDGTVEWKVRKGDVGDGVGKGRKSVGSAACSDPCGRCLGIGSERWVEAVARRELIEEAPCRAG